MHVTALANIVWSTSDPSLLTYCNSNRQTHRILNKAFGPRWRDRIELGPLVGSGCIAQVYRATLLEGDADGGEGGSRLKTQTKRTRDVAIKVLHPNLAESVATDMELLQLIGTALDRRYPYYSMGDALKGFQDVMGNQVRNV